MAASVHFTNVYLKVYRNTIADGEASFDPCRGIFQPEAYQLKGR